MKEEYIKTVNELLGLSESTEVDFKGVAGRAVVGLMIFKQLDRIATALEILGNVKSTSFQPQRQENVPMKR